jgi:hypothetical protein
LSPAAGRHTRTRRVEDTARYLLVPGDDFQQPYLAIPGVNEAFVWPLGVEGFEESHDWQLGIHRYIGGGTDVSVVYQDQMRISMSGLFPGWTSVANKNALERIASIESPTRGKILHLPGIQPRLQYVHIENMRFSHADNDFTEDLAYAISFIRVGVGAVTGDPNFMSLSGQSPSQPAMRGPRGNAGRVFIVTTTANTLRLIARLLFNSIDLWAYLFERNATWFTDRNIPTHQVPDWRLPVGTEITY